MKPKKIIRMLPVFLLLFAGCHSEDNGNPDEWISNMVYEKTELGGCNLKASLRSENSEADENAGDEVIITISEESVRVFVGLSYTCKTVAFETKVETTDDVICMYIIDSGGDYGRCICYYTFDFVFKRENPIPLNQKYKIVLMDPRKEEVRIISEGVIDENAQPEEETPCYCIMDTLKGEWSWTKTQGCWGIYGNQFKSVLKILSQNEDASINYKVFVEDTLFSSGRLQYQYEHPFHGFFYSIILTNLTLPHNIYCQTWEFSIYYQYPEVNTLWFCGFDADNSTYCYQKTEKK